jgi:ubiquinol-cytochrome c reductase iron-sulfur subunit
VVNVIDKRRRRLLIATTTLATAGVGFAAVPFVASMLPSERAKALGGPVEIDFNKLTPGELLTAAWRGKPVWIMRRTPPMLGQLGNNAPLLADPDSQVATQQPSYAKNLYRSIKPELLVMLGICTHLGCVPTPRFAVGHGSKFDLAGRVFKNVPAPTNLVVPPHHFVTDTQVVIGVDPLQRT